MGGDWRRPRRPGLSRCAAPGRRCASPLPFAPVPLAHTRSCSSCRAQAASALATPSPCCRGLPWGVGRGERADQRGHAAGPRVCARHAGGWAVLLLALENNGQRFCRWGMHACTSRSGSCAASGSAASCARWCLPARHAVPRAMQSPCRTTGPASAALCSQTRAKCAACMGPAQSVCRAPHLHAAGPGRCRRLAGRLQPLAPLCLLLCRWCSGRSRRTSTPWCGTRSPSSGWVSRYRCRAPPTGSRLGRTGDGLGPAACGNARVGRACTQVGCLPGGRMS